MKVGLRVKRVLMGFACDFDSVQFMLSDGIHEYFTDKVGYAAFKTTYIVPDDDEIECVRFGIKDVKSWI